MATILVVDDHAYCRELFGVALQNCGHKVLTASDGKDAMRLLQNLLPDKLPDLIVLDAKMPEMDGLTMLRVVKNHPYFKHVPVFLLTAVEERETIIKALQFGASEYILKSTFVLNELLARIQKHLGLTSEEMTERTAQVSNAPLLSDASAPTEGGDPDTRETGPGSGAPVKIAEITDTV